ncbi:MAG: hypothetical protein AAFO03_05090 [Bacteroidota bacterium]
MLNKNTVGELERLVSAGQVTDAIDVAIGEISNRHYLTKVRLITLKSELERKRNSFLTGQISEQEYSVAVNRAATYLLSSSRTTSKRSILVYISGLVFITALVLFTIPFFLQTDALIVSNPTLTETKVSFLIYNNQNNRSGTIFSFRLPEEYQNSLMPSSYVNFTKDDDSPVNIEIIEESIETTDFDPATLLLKMKNIKQNSVEILKMEKGLYKLEFLLKEASNGEAEDFWNFLDVYCKQSDNMEINCKKKASLLHKLHSKENRYLLLFLMILNGIFLSIFIVFFRRKMI